jgi:hypothetical protein
MHGGVFCMGKYQRVIEETSIINTFKFCRLDVSYALFFNEVEL